MRLLHRLWKDQRGFVISTELVLIAVLLVIGLIAGLTTLRDQVVQELADVANAIGSLNQSYSFSGITGHSSSTAGSSFADLKDAGDTGQQSGPNNEPECLNIAVPAQSEG